MRPRRTFKYIAFLVGLLVLGALFLACAADPGDILKLAETNTTGSTTGTGSATQFTQSNTGSTTGSSTGPTGSQTSTGIGTTSSSTGIVTNTGTGSTTGTGTGAVTATSTGSTTGADAAPPPCTTCMLQLTYKAVSTGDGVTSVGFDVQVTNTGSGSQDLTQMTIQYYFTADGATTLAAQVNSASIKTTGPPYYTAITGVTPTFTALSPATSTADTILTISFGAGTLPSQGLLEVDIQFNGNGYATQFTQSNDYSYDGMDTATFTASQTITIDVAGATVWGMAP